jgi:hypothetical protein
MLADLERQWSYRQGLTDATALDRLSQLSRFSPWNVRSRALRNRLLFGYPESVVGFGCAEIGCDVSSEFVRLALERISSEPSSPPSVRAGVQK